jgi:hypothetical protein
MRQHILAISTALLCTTGCYNLVVINVGIGNKSAAAVAAPLDPVVECAALASASLTVNTATKNATADQVANCQQIIAAEKGRKP